MSSKNFSTEKLIEDIKVLPRAEYAAQYRLSLCTTDIKFPNKYKKMLTPKTAISKFRDTVTKKLFDETITRRIISGSENDTVKSLSLFLPFSKYEDCSIVTRKGSCKKETW